MSLTILDQLEEKIKHAFETTKLLQLALEDLKEQKAAAEQESAALRQEHEQLKSEHQNFQDRLRALLGQIDNV